MKFMRRTAAQQDTRPITAGYSLSNHIIRDDILEETEKKLVQYKQKQDLLAGWKMLDARNNSLTIDPKEEEEAEEEEDLDDR